MKYAIAILLLGSTVALAQVPDQAIPLRPEQQPGVMAPPLDLENVDEAEEVTRPPAEAAPLAADRFVAMMGASNTFEIQSSLLALERSQDERVRQFAQRMIADHTQVGERLEAFAPMRQDADLDRQHAQMLQELQAASGDEFDRLYVRMQAQAHQEAVDLAESYARAGEAPQLREFAQQTLPVLQEHLQSILQIQAGS